jgi:GNAT superfamily N-acetyltransferase
MSHTTTIATPRGPITIRPTTADDASRLRALRLEALTNHPTSFGSAPEDVDNFDWTKVATGSEIDAVFVAEHAGQLVGLTGIRRGSRAKEAHHAFIWGVFVQPAHRRCGIAHALVSAAVEWARAQDVAIVKLTVVPETGARSCYERCGFHVTGTDPACLYWEGQYYDELLMSRWLEPNEPSGV